MTTPPGAEPDGAQSRVVRTFFSAYGGPDAAPLIESSSPGGPARAYAQYWSEVIRSGRTSAVAERVDATADEATLTYQDGSAYRFVDLQFDPRNRLVSWDGVPGGALERRIVATKRTARLGPLLLRVLHQFRTPDGDLRVTMAVRNAGGGDVNLARRTPRSYATPGGGRRVVTIGSGPHTGVVPLPAGSRAVVLVAALRAEPGGRLALLAYDDREVPLGEVVVELPVPG
jgi:hypothetical protein